MKKKTEGEIWYDGYARGIEEALHICNKSLRGKNKQDDRFFLQRTFKNIISTIKQAK